MASDEEQKAMIYISDLFGKAEGPSPGPVVKCRGLQSNTYITRDTLSDLITNTYCTKLNGASGEIGTGSYLPDTPETVEISVNGDVSGQGLPTPEDCAKNLHKVLDDCDTDGSTNPMNWKAGGELEIDYWTYSLKPLHDRPPAPQKPSAWCKLENCNADTGCTARLWGAGWLNSGLGHELREAFETQQAYLTSEDRKQQLGGHKGIDTSQWGESFKYELMDGHEWTVTVGMDLGIFFDPGKLIPDTMKAVANSKDPNYLKVDACAVG